MSGIDSGGDRHGVVQQVNDDRGCSQLVQQVEFNGGRCCKPLDEWCLGVRKHPLQLHTATMAG
ncbi:hypothetical protein HanRHA438_Chr05g0203341 [Helianthus annuus]|nr:hypothetical protein HanRHA438_Chr05g0203341 [Helianthus annuus]